ncbi:MAG: DsbA family protein [Archaeoglobus sp.]|nr:DsbA family protein [Archaeoglobus sp.]
MKKEYLLIIGILVGVGVGLAAGYYFGISQGQINVCEPQSPAQPQSQPSQSTYPNQLSQTINQTLIDNSMEYINSYLLQPGITAKLVNVSVYSDDLYKLSLQFERDNQVVGMSDVYLTRDGKTLVLQSVDISKKPEVQRTEVSEDDDPYIGGENAKVTIIEFSDFTCPFCAKFETEILPQILDKYGDKIKFVYRDFPVHGNVSKLAAKAANCAGDQGKYWDFHNMLFERQNKWVKPNESLVEEKLYVYADELGLNVDEFKACIHSEKYEEEIQKDYIDGAKAGVTGTPTIFINGIKVVGAQPVEAFYKVIDDELAGS